MNNHYPFSLMPLPYSYNALKPYLDETTLCFHHDKHLKTYVDNLNKVLEDKPDYHSWNLEKILMNLSEFPESIRTTVKNNAGGVYNHELYFCCMRPEGCEHPPGKVGKAIELSFRSLEQWEKEMKEAAVSQFGSGYAWLVMDAKQGLQIVKSSNQDTPISKTVTPLLNVDVWEHAYYLQYQNRRSSYVDNWFYIINWDFVEQRFCKLI